MVLHFYVNFFARYIRAQEMFVTVSVVFLVVLRNRVNTANLLPSLLG